MLFNGIPLRFICERLPVQESSDDLTAIIQPNRPRRPAYSITKAHRNYGALHDSIIIQTGPMHKRGLLTRDFSFLLRVSQSMFRLLIALS